jgi:NAD(P)-dependent dehydrogenase (short-subunit alcohol dehydrogenase family)
MTDVEGAHILDPLRPPKIANRQRFAGRTALITGGGTGMGRAAALRLAREGARVVIAGRRASELEAVAALIATDGGQALAVPTDVSDEAQVKRLRQQTLDEFRAIDLAWNNAGVLGGFAPLHETGLDDFDAVLAVNLRGVVACLKHELVAMHAAGRGGAIVNTSSWTAHGAMPGIAAYAASKAALDALARTVALEGGPHGIRVNNVSPGVIATPMSQAALGSAEAMRPFALHTPLQRIGDPDDVADAVLWLLSDDARFVTGQSLLVDGGLTLGGPRPWLHAQS